MPIRVRFTSGSVANGLTAIGFRRSQQGVGLFFNALDQAQVANDQALLSALTAPDEFAFRVDSASGVIWRSGPLALQGGTTDTFMIVDAGTQTLTPADLTALLPTPPITSGAMRILTLSLAVGAGTLTASGTGSYATSFGAIPISYTYAFTLDAVTDPADYRFPGGIPPAVQVRTLGMTVTGTAGGFLGFLVNALTGALFGLFAGTVRDSIQGRIQGAVNTAVTAALATNNAPPGTIATVETVTIAPGTGVSFKAWAGFSLERACASNPSSGSVRVRPPHVLAHLRTIRDRLLRLSPRGAAYVATFEHFNEELLQHLLEHEELLKLVDEVVRRTLEELPREDPGSGRIGKETAHAVTRVLEWLEKGGSPELALTAAALREEVRDFVERPVGEVLAASFDLLERPEPEPRQRSK